MRSKPGGYEPSLEDLSGTAEYGDEWLSRPKTPQELAPKAKRPRRRSLGVGR